MKDGGFGKLSSHSAYLAHERGPFTGSSGKVKVRSVLLLGSLLHSLLLSADVVCFEIKLFLCHIVYILTFQPFPGFHPTCSSNPSQPLPRSNLTRTHGSGGKRANMNRHLLCTRYCVRCFSYICHLALLTTLHIRSYDSHFRNEETGSLKLKTSSWVIPLVSDGGGVSPCVCWAPKPKPFAICHISSKNVFVFLRFLSLAVWIFP